MSGREAEDRATERRQRAVELGHELREIIERLSSRELSLERLERAVRLATDLRQALDGERRARWYEKASAATFPNPSSWGDHHDYSPVRGSLNPLAPPLRTEIVERPEGRRVVVGRVRLGTAHEGLPQSAHGGVVAALFDDLLGATQVLAPPVGVTAKLVVRFRNVTPIDEELRFESWIARDRGSYVLAKATCHATDKLTANAEGIFMRVDFSRIREQTARRES
jgi:acyl-coenzyme A thioesterase PaaI-like protein